MKFHGIPIKKYLTYFIFCFSLFYISYSFAIFESPLETRESLFHMKPVEKEEIPQFIEKYSVFVAQQALEAGLFSNEQEALQGILGEEEQKILEASKDPLSNETFYNSWRNENFLFYIYLDKESIPCGYFWCYLVKPEAGEGYASIQTIFIEPEYRGRGIGTAILNALEKELKAQGFKVIILNVFTHNSRAYHLYKKLGYYEVLLGQNELSICYMIKELNN